MHLAGHDVLQRTLVELIDYQPDIEACSVVGNMRDIDRQFMRITVNVMILDLPPPDSEEANAL